MEQQKKMEEIINWAEEKDKLREKGATNNWWRATQGKHLITFLSNGERFITIMEGKEVHKVHFLVEINNEQKDWSVTIGQTKNSLYGQIAIVAADNKLVGKTITLIVKGQGKETSYTVLEAL